MAVFGYGHVRLCLGLLAGVLGEQRRADEPLELTREHGCGAFEPRAAAPVETGSGGRDLTRPIFDLTPACATRE
jgi:hypothetical protein